MSVGFASGETLKSRKDAVDPNKFSLFAGVIPSTLCETDLYMIGLDRKRKQQQQQQKRKRVTYSDLTDDQRNFLALKKYGQLIAGLESTDRECVNCKASFRESTNMTSRACRWHPVKPTFETPSGCGEWGCCGSKYVESDETEGRISGCCKCDHTSTHYDRTTHNKIRIPYCVAMYFKIPEDLVVPDPPSRTTSELDRMCTVLRATYERAPRIAGYCVPTSSRLRKTSDSQALASLLCYDRPVTAVEKPPGRYYPWRM